jgi:CMP/dCMP kinase
MARARPVVAIDGPVGSGKTTVAKLVAQTLGYVFADTGALYRCLALLAREQGVGEGEAARLGAIAAAMIVRFEDAGSRQRVWLGEREVTDAIRLPAISQLASKVSVHPPVRAALLEIQRRMGKDGGVVMEGRDIGTVVFPDAEVKTFLVAPAEVRARRRFEELSAKGVPVDEAQTLAEVRERDRRDEQRALAPLKPARDAILIETAPLSVEGVAARVVELVRAYLARAGQPRS